MPRIKKILSVCKRCGAVGTVKQSHCVLCGASLDKTMQIKTKHAKKRIFRAE